MDGDVANDRIVDDKLPERKQGQRGGPLTARERRTVQLHVLQSEILGLAEERSAIRGADLNVHEPNIHEKTIYALADQRAVCAHPANCMVLAVELPREGLERRKRAPVEVHVRLQQHLVVRLVDRREIFRERDARQLDGWTEQEESQHLERE